MLGTIITLHLSTCDFGRMPDQELLLLQTTCAYSIEMDHVTSRIFLWSLSFTEAVQLSLCLDCFDEVLRCDALLQSG